MLKTFNPIPTANIEIDQPRAENYLGYPLYTHRDTYYFTVSEDNFPVNLAKPAVEKAAEGREKGFPIYFRLQVNGEIFWVDPEEIVETCEQSKANYVLKESDFTTLPPWEEDQILAKTKKPAARSAKGLVEEIKETIAANPGSTLAKISEKLGKPANSISGLVAAMYRNGELRREMEEEASGDRRAYIYWVVS